MDKDRTIKIMKNLAIAAVIYFIFFIFIFRQTMISQCTSVDCSSDFFSGFFLGFIIPYLVIYFIVRWWRK